MEREATGRNRASPFREGGHCCLVCLHLGSLMPVVDLDTVPVPN